ncbi:methylated-DNA--[protein]-cysteine S-methyltransferase [Psychromicrobium lacuslunae]|uniref:Methylated-DNA--protein-cysteine methyltransferase n=1 Tax=Psychromicrobium lacuslunae TaxID=1618207 RepID=A0A0D4C230_9MICC|nr:methylated-DNA--[protein]-cysteine S-methyltransferase [Psychromicrobium lacuslunae]AJT42638.1 cysteine methyltransferase [Psychromicrobium lacuslunae]
MTEPILQPLIHSESATLDRLRARLAAAADQEDELDIAYRTIDSPLGSLLLAATPRGLLRVAYQRENHEQVLQSLAEQVSPKILQTSRRLELATRELEQYFEGRRRTFDVPLDFQLVRGFQRQVLAHLPQIGYGQTESYAQVAVAAGSPRAVRAVGTACARNPLPLIVPCHRVVRADGSFGGYIGGEDAKRALLNLETNLGN